MIQLRKKNKIKRPPPKTGFSSYLFLLIFIGLNCHAEPSALIVKYWNDAMSPGQRPYQLDLITSALEITTDKYGPYELKVSNMSFSSVESIIETEKDGLLNAQFTGTWYGHKSAIVMLRYPYTRGAHGLRQCIIRKENIDDFNKVTTKNGLQKFRFGLGQNWRDFKIFQHNGYNAVGALTYMELLPMLVRNRFDCIPLNVLEIQGTVREMQKTYPNITIAPNLYIYYPSEIYLAVTKSRKDISDRLNEGFKRIFDGDISRKIFERNYSNLNSQILSGNSRIFSLQHPDMSPKENKQKLNEILNEFSF